MQPYWSPPESHMPLVYYEPAYSAPYVFPQSPPYQYLPPPAPEPPRIMSTLHPHAPPFVPKLSIDPLAHALRRTMPKIRSRPPADRRQEPMDDSSISDKFLYVEGVPRNASAEALKTAFEPCGLLRGIFVRLQAERGVVLLAFYDSRHASKALTDMQLQPEAYFDDSTVSARIPSFPELKNILPESPILTESDSRVYVTLVGQTTSIGPQMHSLLSTFGSIKMFRVVGMHYKLFHVEFFDSRDAITAIHSLNNRKVHGAIAHLSTQPDANVVPARPPVDDAELTSRFQAATVDQDAYIPFPSSGASDEPTTPSSIGIGARYGRRASTGSTYPSSTPTSSASASQSTDHLVPFPSTSDDPEQPQQLGRRRSVAHSFDSASSTAPPSYKALGNGIILSSDRTASTAPSTPAGLGRKMSLPPFQGPLPPPSQWSPETPQWSPETATTQWTSPTTDTNSWTKDSTWSSEHNWPSVEDDEPADDGFIPVRRSGGLGGGAAEMCLPASARAVLDLLRDPPPERNRVDIPRIEAGLDTRTTIMLKNIPNKMSAKNLIDFIEVVCPRAIDFLYLRFDFQNECNVGYAFVNFINISDLLKFMKARLGRKWNMYASEKVLGAGYANYQGKEALVEKFRNSSIMETRPAWRPRIFYSSGEHVGLPEPFPVGSVRRVRRSLAHGQGGLYTQMHDQDRRN